MGPHKNCWPLNWPFIAITSLSAHQVLLRALRDFNLGKLTSDDTSIFMGLLNDLFPRTLELVPRAVEVDFESKVGGAGVSHGGDLLGPWAGSSQAFDSMARLDQPLLCAGGRRTTAAAQRGTSH